LSAEMNTADSITSYLLAAVGSIISSQFTSAAVQFICPLELNYQLRTSFCDCMAHMRVCRNDGNGFSGWRCSR
jgi:hypothetical protein